jgi:hypothetical protein
LEGRDWIEVTERFNRLAKAGGQKDTVVQDAEVRVPRLLGEPVLLEPKAERAGGQVLTDDADLVPVAEILAGAAAE